jgi:hypothetical protein
MLKKILILSLILHTSYILSSHSSSYPEYGGAGILLVAGIICTWLAYKDLKNGLPAFKEVNRQLKILNEMGVKVYRVTKSQVEFGSFVIKENYTMNIPLHFSQQQEKKAKEHWNLLLTNDKYCNKMLGWPLVGSVILLPAGIWALWELLA